MDLRACFLGDSYVLGQGDATGLGWPGRLLTGALAQGLDLTVYNLGVRGETAAQVATRGANECRARLRAGDKKAVVLAFGANDVSQGVSPEATMVSLESLIAWSERQRFWTFVVSPPPMPGAKAEACAAMTEAMAQVCAKRNIAVFDLGAEVADWDGWWAEAQAGDGAHPGAASYERLASAFAAWRPWREWLGLV